MTYYRTFIIGAILILLWLAAFFFGGGKKPKFHWNASLLFFAIAIVGVSIISWNDRTANALLDYDRIMSAEKMTVTKDGKTREIPLGFSPEGGVFLYHLDEAPQKVKEADFEQECELEFFNEKGKSVAKIRFGRLLNAADYPEDALVRINGSAYGFLATKFLYKNALYYFSPQFTEHMLSLIE